MFVTRYELGGKIGKAQNKRLGKFLKRHFTCLDMRYFTFMTRGGNKHKTHVEAYMYIFVTTHTPIAIV